MKIIQAHKFYFMKGGAERYVLDISDHLASKGNQVFPFAMKHQDNRETEYARFFPSYVNTEQVRVGWQALRTFGRMLYSSESARKMSSLIHHAKPDFAHIHNIYNQLSPSILRSLKRAQVPIVMTVHDHHLVSPQYNVWAQGCGPDLRYAGFLKATLSRFHKRSFLASFAQSFTFSLHGALGLYRNNIDLFITPSHYMKRQMVQGGFDEKKIRVIYYGIDPHTIEPKYIHRGYFLFVGRLSEEKGVETVVRLARVLPDINFKIVGRGPQMEWLHRLAHGLENIEFLGFRTGDELKQLYRDATAVLLPSRVHENFPLTSLEAMSAGKPLIASNVGGIPEIVEDRVNGFLVAPMDLPTWTESVLRLYHDDDLQGRLSEEARGTVERRFMLDRHYRELGNAYRSVIK
jgi:glycosyltransferase involved in cell wall biosynthesis